MSRREALVISTVEFACGLNRIGAILVAGNVGLSDADAERSTSIDISDVVMKGRSLSVEDDALTLTIRKRVGACLKKLLHQGIVRETAAMGGLKGWVRAG